MSSITYPSGKILTYGYDGAGRVSQVSVDGYALASSITYQPFGAPKSWTWGDGSTMARSFDTDGRMTSHTVGGATRNLLYDLASRIIEIIDGTIPTKNTHDYDNLDRLISYVADATNQAYTYDANGNRTQLIIGAMTYAYTNSATSNQLTATAGPAPARTYTYDAAGNMVGDGSGNYRFDYDERGRLSLAKISATSGGTYRVNGLGQRAVKSGGGGLLFVYDAIGRLLGEYSTNGNPVREYVYLGDIPIGVLTNNAYVLDNAGTEVTVVGTWATVSNDPNDPAAYGSTYRTHAAGSGSETFTWTPALSAGALYRVYARWAAGADRATNATYQVTHLFGTTNVAVNQRQQGGQWVLLGTFSLMFGEGHNVKLTDNANGLVVADAVKFVPADASTVYSIHTDHLDTPRVVKRSSGTILWRWDSDPFGSTPANEDPDGNGILFEFPLRFPGQYFDKETNAHYNYFRDYDPAIGRYIQSDPIGLQGGINTYAYVGGNPIGRTDPLGLEWQFTIGVSGSIGGNPYLPILSPFIGGGLSVGFTTSGQIIVQTQATGSLGVGVYGGVGVQGQVSKSTCLTPSGMSVQQAFQGDFNFGAGPSVGGSLQYDPSSGGAGIQSGLGRIGQGRLGVGYGLQASAGITQTTTFATPALFPSKPSQQCSCQ